MNKDLIRLFACLGIFEKTVYSHHSLHILFKIFAQIHIQIFDLMQKIHVATNTRFRAYIRWRFSHTSKYLLQNICLEAKIRKTSSEFHIKQIFACKVSLIGKYLLHVASNYLEKPFTSLRPQLISILFDNIRLETNIRYRFYSFCM